MRKLYLAVITVMTLATGTLGYMAYKGYGQPECFINGAHGITCQSGGWGRIATMDLTGSPCEETHYLDAFDWLKLANIRWSKYSCTVLVAISSDWRG